MRLHISVARQLLTLFDDERRVLREYCISTGKAGVGEVFGSFQTPRGRHLIRAKIGAGAPENTIFVRRRPTGDLWSAEFGRLHPGRDWILTRILWLSGCEPGRNRLGKVDTMRRYVYIHGAPENVQMGMPASHGCIRMRNADIVDLFERVPVYTPVDISED
ncbi:MAG: L,D-transpeptidase [Dechloromonas sp.]|uniref:L,D-transpeptidase n=1 Tax=Candidatus Dechloromonas phosphorivorans TaxID=2899244 RepID=A0A9D7QIN9_9RHOO|nr:L,D-transpeptidase [Candidatus Dechloromonas phosphorivorans]